MLIFGFIWAATAPILMTLGLLLLAIVFEKIWGAFGLLGKTNKWTMRWLMVAVGWLLIGSQYYQQYEQYQAYAKTVQRWYPDDAWVHAHAKRANTERGFDPIDKALWEGKEGVKSFDAGRMSGVGQMDVGSFLEVVLDSPTANSFGARYILEGFVVQRREYPTTKNWIREWRTVKDGVVQNHSMPIDGPSSIWRIEEVHEEGAYWTVSWTRLWERERMIAQDALVNFRPKGIANVALGAWGSKSSPDVVSDSEGWRRWYYLSCMVLLGKSANTCAKAR